MATNTTNYLNENRRLKNKAQRDREQANLAIETRDPQRTRSGNVSGYGQNKFSTPEQAFMNRRSEALNLERQQLENRVLANELQAQQNRPTAAQTAQSAALADILGRTTTADRLPYSLPALIGQQAPSRAVTNRKTEGGRDQGYFMQSADVNQANLQDVFNQERRTLGAGSGVVMTEGGRVIRLDPQHEYAVQQQIDDPALRNMVPALAQANSGAQQKALMAQAMEFGKAGVPLPEGATLNNLTHDDIYKMSVAKGQAEANRAYQSNYLSLAKIMANVKVPGEFGERSLAPEEIHQQITNVIGQPPASAAGQQAQPAGGGADIDNRIAGMFAQPGAPVAQPGLPAADEDEDGSASRVRRLRDILARRKGANNSFMGSAFG
jgi:hypothetical protein